jgi:hypothetical protein
MEDIAERYLSKDKKGVRRYIIQSEGNRLYFALIETSTGAKVKKIEETESKVSALDEDVDKLLDAEHEKSLDQYIADQEGQ